MNALTAAPSFRATATRRFRANFEASKVRVIVVPDDCSRSPLAHYETVDVGDPQLTIDQTLVSGPMDIEVSHMVPVVVDLSKAVYSDPIKTNAGLLEI